MIGKDIQKVKFLYIFFVKKCYDKDMRLGKIHKIGNCETSSQF